MNDLYSLCDPVTSAVAANAHLASGRLSGNRRRALDLVRRWPGMTATELAAKAELFPELAIDRIELSRRLADLKNLGHVRQGPVKKCGIKKSAMVTWEPSNP